ncbi:unnamed protein product [Schistocephalus solidus]|uniref:SCAN box domain-containing protein n=1 Tax=Schistocephalus solidus TaxID=70667 RepID=A0A183TEV5_SCHSO|nr:unnamed protein product [Schistocephalus solidus]
MNATALNARVLEQFLRWSPRPQIRKALLLDQLPAIDKALTMAREEEVLQGACEQPPRSLLQPCSPTPSKTPAPKRLGTPAPAAPLPAEITGDGLSPVN